MMGDDRPMVMATLAVALSTGCGPATPSEAAPSSVEPSTPASTTAIGTTARRDDAGARDADIIYEDADGKPFPYPLVRARVRGAETRLILDTGASHTVLDVWLLAQLGVELVASERAGEGHGGEKVATMRARSPHLELEGWGPVDGDVLAVRFPPVFRNLGLGGVVSPQSLALPGMAVLLDLPASSLRTVSREQALREGAAASLGAARACAVGGEPEGVIYVVDGAVAGQSARLVVDSGAARSDLLSESAAGRRLRAQAGRGDASYTVSGRVQGKRLDGATVSVGRVKATLDLGIMPGAPAGACPRDGHLGLDVLRRCVLFLAPDHFGAQCDGS